MWKSDLVKHEAGRLMGKLYYPVGDSGQDQDGNRKDGEK